MSAYNTWFNDQMEEIKNTKKPKNLKKITSDLYVDWSQLPKNIPVTPIKIDINKTEKDNENVA